LFWYKIMEFDLLCYVLCLFMGLEKIVIVAWLVGRY